MMALLSLLICVEMSVLMFSVLILSALGRLNQMQQVGNSNVQTEATWFMKIGEHVMSVKCISFTELSTVILIKVITMNGMLFLSRVTPLPSFNSPVPISPRTARARLLEQESHTLTIRSPRLHRRNFQTLTLIVNYSSVKITISTTSRRIM